MFPPEVIAAARASMQKWGIPASVTLAQWALESGWGQHMPPGSNNPFGIKATTGQPSVTVPTHEVIGGRTVVVEAAFRCFPSLADAFDAHAQLLATAPAYARARATMPTAFANALTGVYATDPHYGSKLVGTIGAYRLQQYDTPIGNAGSPVDGLQPPPATYLPVTA